MACPILPSSLSFLTLGAETTWGTVPGSPTYVHCPVATYGVKLVTENRQSSLFTGNEFQKHNQKRRGNPQGQVVAPMFGWQPSGLGMSLAQYLFDWGFDIPASDPCVRDSKFAEWAEGPDVANRRHTGLRVASATLAGDSGSGQVTIALDLQGKDEATFATAQAVPDDMNSLVDFDFSNVTLTLGGTSVAIRSFELKVDYSMQPLFENSTRPVYLLADMTSYTFNVTLAKEDDTYAALHRALTNSELTAVLSMQGSHEGTGTALTDDTKLAITMARCALIDDAPTFNRGQAIEEALNFLVLKPDTTDNPIESVWSEV